MASRTTKEVIADLDGRLTYRVLDYWLRTGAITIADNGTGSGSYRLFSDEEFEALGRFVTEYEKIQDALEDLRSGFLWSQITGS